MVVQTRLRILHFVYDHPNNPWVGGGGAGRAWSVNYFLAKRHDITVLCGAFPGAGLQDEPFKVRFLGNARSHVESRLKFIRAGRGVDATPYDLIIEDVSYYSPIFSRFAGRPVVSILHSRQGLKALQYHPFYGLISLISQHFLVRKRSAVILVSEYLRPAVNRNALVAVIPQGVSIPDTLPPPSEEYALFLGRLDVRIKGLDILIKAWAQLSRTLELPLHIVGGGDKDRVVRLIRSSGAKNVYLRGWLDHEEAMAAMNRAALVIVPSRDEGSPLVLHECFALGKPVIGSSIPALKDFIPHGIAGLQVPPADHKALARAIERLINDKDLRSRLAKGARKMGKRFLWEKIAEEQEAFYWEVMNKRKLFTL